jgi:hypothetical protein
MRSQIVSAESVPIVGETEDPAETPSSALTNYRTLLGQVPKLIRELRDTRHLQICDLAERIELIALRECLRPVARNHIGESLYESLLTLLADNQARDDARYIALANERFKKQISDPYVAHLLSVLQLAPGTMDAREKRTKYLVNQTDYQLEFNETDVLKSVFFIDEKKNTTKFIGFFGENWRGEWEIIPKALISKGQGNE